MNPRNIIADKSKGKKDGRPEFQPSQPFIKSIGCFSFSFFRRIFSHLLDSAPKFQTVPYQPCQAGPSLKGTSAISRHFSNKESLSKPKITLGSPLGSPLRSCRAVRGVKNK